MMDRALLVEFCANDQESRYYLRTPWREDDGRVVATDGRVMIILDDLPGDFPAHSPSLAKSVATIALACDKQWVNGWGKTWIRVSDVAIPDNTPCTYFDTEEKPGCYRCYWTGIETVAKWKFCAWPSMKPGTITLGLFDGMCCRCIARRASPHSWCSAWPFRRPAISFRIGFHFSDCLDRLWLSRPGGCAGRTRQTAGPGNIGQMNWSVMEFCITEQ